MSRRRRFGWAALALAAAIGAGLWLRHPGPAPGGAPARAGGPAAPAAGGAFAGGAAARAREEIVSATPPEILHYADALDGPGRSGQDDVQLLSSLLQLYRRVTQGTNPVGDNAEITAVLTGKNRLGYAFIRPDHPAINPQGELCDRWGTPYFFHQISGTVMQVRSAGPDRRHWTADDFVAGP